jgi:hypothetical protein
MLTIRVDLHKQSHTAVAADEIGVEVGSRTAAADWDGFGELLMSARRLPDS